MIKKVVKNKRVSTYISRDQRLHSKINRVSFTFDGISGWLTSRGICNHFKG